VADQQTQDQAAPASGSIQEIRFPYQGVVRRFDYHNPTPNTTPFAQNVRPFDTISIRERGGRRPGLAKSYTAELGGGQRMQTLTSAGILMDDGSTTYSLVGAAGGSVYYTSGSNILQATGSLNAIAPNLQAAQMGLMVYFADYRPIVVGGGGILTDGVLTSPDLTDWRTLNVDTANDVVLLMSITDSTGNVASDSITDAQANNYTITTVAPDGGSITTSAAGQTPPVAGNCTWQLGRSVKTLNPATGTLAALTATFGIVPLGCPLIATYRDRLVLAGPDASWYMSRQGDATDWDYGAYPDDTARAVAGANTTAGGVGEDIIALIPHSDDYMIFGCASSIWMLQGDPASGGQINAISRIIGIVNQGAWCRLPDSTLMILSRDGLYIINPGAGTYPQPFSRDVLPADLIDVDGVNNTVSMIYESRYRGVHLYVTPNSGSAGQHWWIDSATQSFWPVSLPSTMQPTAVCNHVVSTGNPKYTILGALDGYLRHYDETAETDDGTAINAYVQYGPIFLGNPGYDGLVSELSADCADFSENVTVSILAGDTPENAAVATTPTWTATLAAGRNRPLHPRVRAVAASLEISGSGRWAMESLRLRVGSGGRVR
jgi:hypothetical protein